MSSHSLIYKGSDMLQRADRKLNLDFVDLENKLVGLLNRIEQRETSFDNKGIPVPIELFTAKAMCIHALANIASAVEVENT